MLKELGKEELLEVISAMALEKPLTYLGDLIFEADFYGKVYSKGRPRFSGKGHTYTPANTRKFEKAVKDFLEVENCPYVFHPVRVLITLIDPFPKSMRALEHKLADKGVVFATVGDVDNRAKSILDACNDVLLMDDSQVSSLHVSRQYGLQEGFSIRVCRSGYSKNEVRNMSNLLKGRKK